MVTKEIKKNHIANLIKIAKADNKLTQEEVIFIKTVAIKLGLSSADFNEVALNVESIKSEPPVTNDGKIQVLYDILTLMSLDMTADSEEVEICKHIGGLMGFTDEQLSKVIQLSIDNLDNVLSKEQMEEALN